MNNFDTVFRGYDKEQVKSYLDKVIKEYERLLNEKKLVDSKLVGTDKLTATEKSWVEDLGISIIH